MKKTAIIAFSVLLVLALAIPSFAASGSSGNSTRSFVDADGDGVCDNYGTYPNFVDADGDGVCDNYGTCQNFVDADGDGVCDNCGTYRHCVNTDGDGICNNYAYRNCVDADGDGVCDNCPNGGIALHNGTGMHYGRGGGRR